MRPFLVLLPLLLLPASASSEPLPGVQATATGTVAVTSVDGWTGESRCNVVPADVVVEAGGLNGLFAWHAPECPDLSTGAKPFLSHCSDACFPGCRVDPEEIRCQDGHSPDGWGWVMERLRLTRAGGFTYTREVWDHPDIPQIQAMGTVDVVTWPDAS